MSGPRRFLVTGGGGQLSSELAGRLAGLGAVSAPTHAELDVTDTAAVSGAVEEAAPDVVINCAAFHNLDVCEREEAQAFAVNATAVKGLARLCAERAAKLVHISTNYVFDGARPDPYSEYDAPSPRSIYAISKLAGEYAALAYAPGALVIRSAGLYGLHGSASKGGNFVTRMLNRARAGEPVRVVTDQLLSPTFTSDLADGILAALARNASGLVHMTNQGSCSWHEFTVAIMELAGLDVEVERVTTAEFPAGADRPLNGVLADPGARAASIPPLRHWRDALTDYMTRAGLVAATG